MCNERPAATADTDIGLVHRSQVNGADTGRRMAASQEGGRAWNQPPTAVTLVSPRHCGPEHRDSGPGPACDLSPGLSAGSPGDLDGPEDNAVDSLSLSGEEGGVSDPEDSADGDASSRPSSTPLYEGEWWVQPPLGGGGRGFSSQFLEWVLRLLRRSRTQPGEP